MDALVRGSGDIVLPSSATGSCVSCTRAAPASQPPAMARIQVRSGTRAPLCTSHSSPKLSPAAGRTLLGLTEPRAAIQVERTRRAGHERAPLPRCGAGPLDLRDKGGKAEAAPDPAKRGGVAKPAKVHPHHAVFATLPGSRRTLARRAARPAGSRVVRRSGRAHSPAPLSPRAARRRATSPRRTGPSAGDDPGPAPSAGGAAGRGPRPQATTAAAPTSHPRPLPGTCRRGAAEASPCLPRPLLPQETP